MDVNLVRKCMLSSHQRHRQPVGSPEDAIICISPTIISEAAPRSRNRVPEYSLLSEERNGVR